MKDEAVAEDVVQEVILKYLKIEDSISLKVKLSTYLHRAVINQALDHLRKDKKITALPLTEKTDMEEESPKNAII